MCRRERGQEGTSEPRVMHWSELITENSLGEITALCPQRPSGKIYYKSSGLADILLQEAQKTEDLGGFIKLFDDLQSGHPIKVVFSHDREGKVSTVSLRDQEQKPHIIHVHYDPQTFERFGITERRNNGSWVITAPDGDYHHFASDRRLLGSLFKTLSLDLSNARLRWSQAIREQGRAYSETLKTSVNPDAPRLIGALIQTLEHNHPDTGLIIAGKPIAEAGEQTPQRISLRTTTPVNEELYAKVSESDRPEPFRESIRYELSRHSATGIITITSTRRPGNDFQITLETQGFLSHPDSDSGNRFERLFEETLAGKTSDPKPEMILLWHQPQPRPIEDPKEIGFETFST